MSPVLPLLSVITCLITGCFSCMDPVPDYLTQIEETDDSGTIVLTMYDPPSSSSSSSWSIRITSPANHATYLETFFDVVHNSSTSPQWKVVLAGSLDVEQIQKDKGFVLSDLILDVQCTDGNSQNMVHYQHTVIIRAVSEFKPFVDSSLPRFNVSEASTVDTVVARLENYVTDEDVQNNGQPSDVKQFTTQAYDDDDGNNDLVSGDNVFGVTTAGDIILIKPLDYERGPLSYGLNVTVEDTGGLTSSFIVAIDVLNENDNPPMFVTKTAKGELLDVAEYRATVSQYYTGPITLEPGPIQATDIDGDVIRYYIKTGHPEDYSSYLSLDVLQGTVLLTRPLNDSRVSHFTLIIEARDGLQSKRSGDSDNDFHTTPASLLIFVSSKNVDFPGTPRSGTSSSIASVNSDALFISVIALATLSLLLIIVVVVLCCKMKRRSHQKDKFPGVDRCNTLKERKPNAWSIQMRPVDRANSEKAFMRSLSRSTPYINEGFVNEKLNDDVFVTGIVPYTNTQLNSTQHSRSIDIDQDIISRGIIPYSDHNEEVIDSAMAARHSASTLPRSVPLSPPIESFTNFTSNQTTVNAPGSNNFESLDVHTSVKPIAEVCTRPKQITHDDSIKASAANNGTLKSLNSADVMHELDQIIFNENRYTSERGEKVTNFSNESTTQHNTLNSRDGQIKGRTPEEGITSFARDSIDFGVLPFDNTSNVGSVKTFLFPGEQNTKSPGTPGSHFRNDPVLNSADVYYRHNTKSK